jgi:hypothetical protein
MRAAVLLAAVALAAPGQGAAAATSASKPAAPAAAPARDELTEAEREFCSSEVEVVERRKKLFESQGLPAAEVARKNEAPLGELADCRRRFKEQGRRAVEQKQDLEEAARRAGPNATEVERERVWREVRRERLASKSPSSLNEEEKAELAAGMGEELKATHEALDDAHQRDKAFMRVVHSAIACHHTERREELKEAIASEEALVKLGNGDRLRLYSLKSELRASEEVLARNAEAARALPSGLDRCTTPAVAVVSHCLAMSQPEAACESEEIQQYLRFVK